MSRRRNQANDDGWKAWNNYFDAKKAKLEEQYKEVTAQQVEKISDLFSGIYIFVNGLTSPSAEELKVLMGQHGGVYQVYQNSSTTHIIASNLPNIKINKLGSVPIVKPSWITDSISLSKLLDYKRYLLYTNQSVSQPKLEFPVIQKTKTASDPHFLEEFYNNSRLHLIATLGTEYKQYISDLRDKAGRSFPGREKLAKIEKDSQSVSFAVSYPIIIMHIDMDCFFVSVGLRKYPELRGEPVAVTHARNSQINSTKEREEAVVWNLDRMPSMAEIIDSKSSLSEVASCSYEARKCGVRNGMFLGAAAKLCPAIKTIPYDFEGYKEVSMILYQTLASYTLNIEAVSCDEMYVDITDLLKTYNLSVDTWAKHIRSEIFSITGCPCSTGFGANRLQARLATRKAKPEGVFHLKPEDVESYMAGMAVADLPGVGSVTLDKLKSLGLETCGDLQAVTIQFLQREVGAKAGETLFHQARGIDKKPLNFHYERKSISAEINYGIRFKNVEECYRFLESLSNEVWNRLSEVKMRTKCITLKLMVRAAHAPVETAKFLGHGSCDSLSKSTTCSNYITDASVIYREIRKIYEKCNVDFGELRGLGIQLTKLEKIAVINPALNRFLQQESKPKVAVETKVEATPAATATLGDKPGRGRPKGSKSKPDRRTKSAIDNFFKTSKDGAFNKSSKADVKQETVDLEVLQALPPEIREEVIKEYNLQMPLLNPKRIIEEKPIESFATSPFTNLEWDEIKPIIYEWMKAEEERPSKVDVEMLAEHFREMAMSRKIETLKIALNFLHRNFSKLGCSWHKAFKDILSLAQQGMVAKYGSTLFINKKFVCC